MFFMYPVWLVILCFGFAIDKKNITKFYFCVSLCLSVIAFFLEPVEGLDIAVHYNSLDMLREMNLVEFIDFLKTQPLVLRYIYFYLVSKLQFNGFLPAITTFIIYQLTFTTIHKYSKYTKISHKYELISALMFFWTFDFFDIMGIRQQLIFAIFTYFLFDDLILNYKRKRCFIAYICCSLIHNSAMILIAVRLLLFLPIKNYKKYLTVPILLWLYFINFLISIVEQYIHVPYISLSILKLNWYLQTSPIDVFGNILIPRYILRVLMVVVILVVLIILGKHIRKMPKNIQEYNMFYLFISAFSVGSINSYYLFQRFQSMLVFFVPIFFITFKSYKKNENLRISLYVDRLLFVVVTLYFIWGVFLLLVNYPRIPFKI